MAHKSNTDDQNDNHTQSRRQLCKIIFGTTELGSNVDKETSRRMLYEFISRHSPTESVYLDTSSVYGRGESEKSLSMIHSLNIPAAQRPNIEISTKVHALKGLDKRGVHQQFATSLKRMGVDQVDILYIHQPSSKYPILPTLVAINELYQQGKIQRFGLCNFPSWMVCDVVHLCRKHGLLAPSVYQGVLQMVNGHVLMIVLSTIKPIEL